MAYVLVVDDDEPIRNVLRRNLVGWGYNVRTASNAKDALELMFAERATIALIDIRMPGRDGLWLTEKIKERWRDTAVVTISGIDDIDTVEACKKLGVVDYVMKPFSRESLRQAMDRAAKAAEN